MKNKKMTAAVAAFVLTVITVAVRFLFLKNNVEPATLFVNFGSNHTALAIGVAAVGFLCFGILYASGDKDSVILHRTVSGTAVRAASVIFAVAFAVLLVYAVADFGAASATEKMPASMVRIIVVTKVLLLVSSALGAVYFIMLAAGKCGRAVGFLSNFPSLWFTIALLRYFIETAAYVNLFGRSLFIAVYAVCAFALMYEARLTVYPNSFPKVKKETEKDGNDTDEKTDDDDEENDKNSIVKHRVYAALAGTSAFALAVKAVPELLVLGEGFAFRENYAYYLCEVIGIVYFAVRAFAAKGVKPETDTEE